MGDEIGECERELSVVEIRVQITIGDASSVVRLAAKDKDKKGTREGNKASLGRRDECFSLPESNRKGWEGLSFFTKKKRSKAPNGPY